MEIKNGTKLILGITILLIIILGLIKYTRPITEVRDALIANPKTSGDTEESSAPIPVDEGNNLTRSGGGGQGPDNSGNPPGGGGPEPTEQGPAQSSSGSSGGSRNSSRGRDVPTTPVNRDDIKPETNTKFVVPETIKTAKGEVKIKIAEPEKRFIFTKILSLGSEDIEVREIQKQLKNEGLFSFSITNYFGPITFEAVKQFQQKHNLTATGFVDLITNSYLNTSKNIEFSEVL